MTLAAVADCIRQAQSVVALTGAGISTESGIPDFRSATGIYSQRQDAMELLSLSTFRRDPERFYRFFREAFLRWGDLQPNRGHRALAALEKMGKLRAIVTQNIDGLHQKAGSSRVLELHGNLQTATCHSCGRQYPMEVVRNDQAPVPLCPECHHPLQPDIVLFEQALPEQVVWAAVHAIENCQLLLVVGTSLTVAPACNLVDVRPPGARLVIINNDPTPYDPTADYIIRGSAGAILEELVNLLNL